MVKTSSRVALMTSQWPDWVQHLLDTRHGQDEVALSTLPSIHEPEDNGASNENRSRQSDGVDPLHVEPPVSSRDTARLSADPARVSNPSTPNSWDASSSAHDSRSATTDHSNGLRANDEPKLVVRRRERRVVVTPSQDRLVHRRLRGIHLSVSGAIIHLVFRGANITT